MAGDYVDMTEEQKEWVRVRIERAFAWHREQELPEYRRFLERVLEQSRDDISVEEARVALRDIRESYHRTLDRIDLSAQALQPIQKLGFLSCHMAHVQFLRTQAPGVNIRSIAVKCRRA